MASTTAMDVLEELSSDSSEKQVQPRKPEKAKREKDRPKKGGPEKKAKKEKQEKAKPEKKPKKKPEKEKPEGEKLEKKPKKDKQEKAKPKKKPEQENREQETPEQEKPGVQQRRSLRQSIREDEHRARLIRRSKNSFAIYFLKVLKNIHVGLSLSQRSVNILDSFVKDMFERIASEASFLARQARNSTINSREIQTAIRLLLPGELCRRAVAEGTMAMVRYISNK